MKHISPFYSNLANHYSKHKPSFPKGIMLKIQLKFLLIPVFIFSNATWAQSNDQLEIQCNQLYDRIVSKATAAQAGASAKGDFAEVTRINLIRSIEIRNLYSSQCVNAKRATPRRELGQRGIDMNKSLCVQFGMGDQCAAPPVLAGSPSNASNAGARNSNNTGSSDSDGRKSFKDPQTGRDCVTKVGADREGDKFVRIKVQNICSGNFSYKIRLQNGSTRGTGVGPGTPNQPATSSLVCEISDQCESGRFSYD